MPSTLVGRDAMLELAFSTVQTTGRLLLEGPAGIGKTALLQALIALAHDRGMVVLRCAPTETETALPLAALADLLHPLAGDVDLLPPRQQQAARSGLLLATDSAPLDELALASATRSLLDAAAQRSPAGLLVSIDDAPWLDPPSQRALQFALRRASADVRVVATRRTGDRDDPQVPLELDSHASLERMSLTPLGVGPLFRLLAERFDVALSRPTVARVARESEGNPLLAIELTRAALRLPQLPGPGGDFPVPASMQELVEGSLATLPVDCLRAARLAALLSVAHLGELEAAGVRPEAADMLEEAGLVTVDAAGCLRFAHPVYASAIRAGIPAGVRRRLHALLAETTPDRDERARQLAQATTGRNDEVAAELADAAERVRARGAPELAAEFYDRAAQLTIDSQASVKLALRALYCLFDCGHYRQAADRADVLSRELAGDLLAEALLLRSAIAFSVDDLPLAADTARRALAAATPGSRLAGRVHAQLSVFVDLAAPARAHAEAALALLDADGAADAHQDDPRGPLVLGGTDQALLASVLMLVFLNEVRTGLAPRLELLERALALEAGNPSWLAGTIPAIWWKAIDEPDRARQRLHFMLDLASSAGDEPLQHELMEHLGETETLAGDYQRAAGWITRAGDLADQLGVGGAAGRWLGGTLAALRGQLEQAHAAGQAGLAEAAESQDPWLHRISLQLTAFVALLQGRASDAAAGYAELAEALDASDLVEPLGSRFEPDWIEACVGAGDLRTAELALHRLARRHARLPRPWTALALARSRLLIAGAAGQDSLELLAELATARDAAPAEALPLDRARALVVIGLAHRRARRKLAARQALLSAAAEFEAIGATTFATRARADADRTGTRATPDELTSSELRVAELAATGATNREIADALFISPKTVEANLARAYRKLAIGRRVELAAALQARRG